MLKDTPKGLLEAVIAIHTQSRADYIKEQQTRMSGKEGPADPPAHQGAKKMASWPSHLMRSGSAAASTAEPRGGAGIKKGRAYGGGMQKEAAEGSMPRNEREKKLAAMTPPRNKITHGDVLHGRGVRKESMDLLMHIMEAAQGEGMKAHDVSGKVVHVNGAESHEHIRHAAINTLIRGFHIKPDQAVKLHDKHASSIDGYGKTPSSDQKATRVTTIKAHANKIAKAVLSKEPSRYPSPEHKLPSQHAANKKAEEHAHTHNMNPQTYEKTSGAHSMRVYDDEGEKVVHVKGAESHEHIRKAVINTLVKSHGYSHAHATKLHDDVTGDIPAHTDTPEPSEKTTHTRTLKGHAQVLANHIAKIGGKTSYKEGYSHYKEEAEQIDEISKETLRSYLKSATKSYEKAHRDAEYHRNRGNQKDQAAAGATTFKRASGIARATSRLTKEEKDTPGNGYSHQCAIHVKSEQYGEGHTLTSQHAEPDADGNIAWYDVMFDEGIKRVFTDDLEILVSESHMNHKKKKSM